MAKNQKNVKPAEEAPKAEEKPKATETTSAESIRKKWIVPVILDAMESMLLILLATVGLKRSSNQSGGNQQPDGTPERQMPMWLMHIFPSLTRDDDDEHSQIRDSHPTSGAKDAEEEFKENLAKEGVYDDTRYVINLIGLRRRFIEQTKNPSPEAKESERLSFQKLTINDSAEAFISELLVEKNAGGTKKEIYERQKIRALRRNLLPKIHIIKKFRLEILIGMFIVPWAVIQFVIWLLNQN